MERKPDSGAGDASASYWTDPIEVVRAQLDGLMNHITSGVATYEAVREGEDFLFVGFNRAAEKIEQIKGAEIIGRSVLEVFPGVREFGLVDVFRRVWQTGQPEWHPVSVYKDDRLSGWRQN